MLLHAVDCWPHSKLPLPPPATMNGFCLVDGIARIVWEMVVLPNWLLIPLVGVSGVLVVSTAFLSIFISLLHHKTSSSLSEPLVFSP